MEKVWVVEDPGESLPEYLPAQETMRITRKLPPPAEKDPAVAYSLSLFFWGAGQIYSGQKEKGLWFLLSMLLSCTGAILMLRYGKTLLHVLRSHGISSLVIFLAAEVLLFCALVFWKYNAGDAYHAVVRARKTPFTTASSHVYPFLCSVLIPGWGQYPNGQPVKGCILSCCSIFSLFSAVSIPVTLLVWPSLEASSIRAAIEGIFTQMVLFAPLIPLLWIFGSFDAYKVSIDDLKKETLIDRIKHANYCRRTQGLVRGVIPQIRSTLFLMLFLAFLLIISRHLVPKQFYLEQLADAQTWLRLRGMTIVPALIGRLLAGLG